MLGGSNHQKVLL